LTGEREKKARGYNEVKEKREERRRGRENWDVQYAR
jgi:hypothetical protein